MKLDDSHARAIASRYTDENHDNSVKSIGIIARTLKIGKKRSHYENFYDLNKFKGFYDFKVIGTNRRSGALCLTLARFDNENITNFHAIFIDHSGEEPKFVEFSEIKLTLHSIQRLYQREIAKTMHFSESNRRHKEMQGALADVFQIAGLWIDIIINLWGEDSFEEVVSELTFPIPSKHGMFLSRLESNQLVIRTFVSNSQLTNDQIEVKNSLLAHFRPFIDSIRPYSSQFEHENNYEYRLGYFDDIILLRKLWNLHCAKINFVGILLTFSKQNDGKSLEKFRFSESARNIMLRAANVGDKNHKELIDQLLSEYIRIGDSNFFKSPSIKKLMTVLKSRGVTA